MDDKELMFGARRLVRVCAQLKEGERVLIITDHATDAAIAAAITAAVEEAGNAVATITVANAKVDSGEPPAEIAQALTSADVVFTPVQVSITHTHAVRAACTRGARIVVMTQWIPSMMKGGGIEADFCALEPRVMAVARHWDLGNQVRVTANAGTNMTMDISGRLGTPHAKTGIVRPGQFHPIPDVESPVSPVTGEGVIVCDASIPYLGIGLLDEPVTLWVEAGNVIRIEGGTAADLVREAWRKYGDPNVYNLAEFALGMNPMCRLIGRMLEDEGVATTCHFGIGTSDTLGGQIKAACHYDFVVNNPTVTVDGKTIMLDGLLQVETLMGGEDT